MISIVRLCARNMHSYQQKNQSSLAAGPEKAFDTCLPHRKFGTLKTPLAWFARLMSDGVSVTTKSTSQTRPWFTIPSFPKITNRSSKTTLRLAPCSSPAPSHEVAFKYHQIISNPSVDDALNIFIKCMLSRVFPSSRSPCLVDPWKKATGKVSQRLSNSRIYSLVGQAPTREAVKSKTCSKRSKDVGVSKNRGTPKWMVYNENPFKMDDLGVPLFSETSMSFHNSYN